MKTPYTTTTSSTNKLVNRKLNINGMSDSKYVQNKIYITTKHVQNNPLGVSNQNQSMKKVIQSKLDIIKQQISRQINQHYQKHFIKQSKTKRNVSQLSSGSKMTSRSRVKSEKNVNLTSSGVKMKKSHSKVLERSNKYSIDRMYDEENTLKPVKLFETFFPQPRQSQNDTKILGQSQNDTKILGQSISRINFPSSSDNNYKEKYLNLNERFLQEKERLLETENRLGRLRSSVESYFVSPEETTMREMLECLGLEQGRGNVEESVKAQRMQRVEERARYMLGCYEDIEEFKYQLEEMLQLTSTTSLQQLKSLLKYKFSSSKPMPQSIDEFTYRFLQLESSNNRLKQEYEKMIVDVREKGDMQMYQLKKNFQKQKEKYKLKIKHLQNQVFQRENLYERLLVQIGRITTRYSQQLKSINQHQLPKMMPQNNGIRMNVKQNDSLIEDHQFVEKIKKLSELDLKVDNVQDTIKEDLDEVELTPKYTLKERQLNEGVEIQSPVLQRRKSKFKPVGQSVVAELPRQVSELKEILEELVSQLGSIKYQAEENILKLRQANEAIFCLDRKMCQIKDQLEEQVKEQQLKVQGKQRVIDDMTIKEQGLNQALRQLQFDLALKEQQIIQMNNMLIDKQNEMGHLREEIQQLKDQILVSNKKTIELFNQTQQMQKLQQSVHLFIKGEFQYFLKTIETIDVHSETVNIKNGLNSGEQKLQLKQCQNENNNNNDYHENESMSHVIPTLQATLREYFSTIIKKVQKKLYRQQQYHRQLVQKQKEWFQLVEKVKNYQKSILSLEQSLNSTITQKEEYEFLLTELRQEYQVYKKEKAEEIILVQKKNDHELINANRVILQQNAKLNQEIAQLKSQNVRINKLLQQKVNERTFYRRKASQIQTSIQQKDSKILQLEKQCNKYRIYMDDIDSSFQELLKTQQSNSQKISLLQNQNKALIQEIQRLKEVNVLLGRENQSLREHSNTKKMQSQKTQKRMSQLIQTREECERVNVELRMKQIQLQQCCDRLEEKIKKLNFQLQKQKKTVDRLQRENNVNLKGQNQLFSKLQQKDVLIEEQKERYSGLWKVLEDKEETINRLMREIQRFEGLKEKIEQQQEQNERDKEQMKRQQVLREQLQEREKRVCQKEENMKKMTEQLAKRECQLKILEETIINKQQTIRQRQISLKESQEKIAEWEQTVRQKMVNIGQKEQRLRQREDNIREREETLRQREDNIKQREDKVKQRQDRFRQGESTFIQREETTLRKQQNIMEKQKNLQNLENNLNQKQQTLEQRIVQFQKQQQHKNYQLQLCITEIKIRESHCKQRKEALIQRQRQLEGVKKQLESDRIEMEEKLKRINQKLSLLDELEKQISLRLDENQTTPIEHPQSKSGSQQEENLLMTEGHQSIQSSNKEKEIIPLQEPPLTSLQEIQVNSLKKRYSANDGKQRQQQYHRYQRQNHQWLQSDCGRITSPKRILLSSESEQKHNKSPYSQTVSDQINMNDVALLYSQKRLISMYSHRHGEKSPQEWISEINLILGSLISEAEHSNSQDSATKVCELLYYDQIKQQYSRVLCRLLRQPTPLQLDLSQIECKNSMSSPSSIGGNRLFVMRYNSIENDLPDGGEESYKEIGIKRSNTGGRECQSDISIMTYQLKVDHLSEVKNMLNQKLQSLEKENTQLKQKLKQSQQTQQLRQKITELQSKLYTYEDFANDELKVGVLWNLFKQIIAAYNQDDLEKFERVCRILFKMLNYPQRDIQMFNINWENRKKKNKFSSFFTRWIKDSSPEKKQHSAKKKK